MLLFASLALAAPTLQVSGACPGPMDIFVTEAGAGFALVVGTGIGTGTVDLACGAAETGLALPRVRGRWDRGYVSGTVDIPDPVCGMSAVVVDLETCEASAVEPLDGRWVLEGSFAVNDGPRWSEDAPPLSCVEACAEVFGGHAAGYACSTNPDGVDNLAHLSGYGDDTYCTEGAPDTWVVGTHTDCGFDGCYYSAYTDDHCEDDAVNYCFR